ncbi:MAG: pyridoxamine 5'-phosphate oxidase family protein [Rickettsiales bacterium]|jgi:uncharacterized pyridoxamine 5'-phosphate oxidase family protein|nr:pyridoxamine 5'-phosphate oxidase family protein [Rickettsiales bacterium]
MNLAQQQIKFIEDNEKLILASADKGGGKPRAIIVIPSLVESDSIVISNMQMQITSENIRANPNVFLASYDKDFRKYMKISGTAQMFSDGELFNRVKALEATRCDLIPREIIVVHLNDIFEGEEGD